MALHATVALYSGVHVHVDDDATFGGRPPLTVLVVDRQLLEVLRVLGLCHCLGEPCRVFREHAWYIYSGNAFSSSPSSFRAWLGSASLELACLRPGSCPHRRCASRRRSCRPRTQNMHYQLREALPCHGGHSSMRLGLTVALLILRVLFGAHHGHLALVVV
jgi:hypothetical protein